MSVQDVMVGGGGGECSGWYGVGGGGERWGGGRLNHKANEVTHHSNLAK